jgi:hypothetical protein
MPAEKPIPLEGVLNCWNDPYDLPDILLAVSRSGKTGRLSFSNPEADKTLYVKDGRFVFAESSSEDDGLGEYLLRNGQISLEDFTRLSKLASPARRMGALLVAEGLLEPKDLMTAVIGQVRWIILGLFKRTESWYGFKKDEPPRKETPSLDLPIAELVLDGLSLIDSWRRVSKGIGDLDAVYRVAPRSEPDRSRVNLDSGPTELLEMLQEPMRVRELCAQVSLDGFDTCRYLWAFKVLGWIEPAEIPVEAAEPVEIAPPPPPLPPPLPPAPPPRPDLATTVLSVEPPPPAPAPPAPPAQAPQPPPGPPPIPQRLVETKISATREPEPARRAPLPKAAAAPLHHTQLYIAESEKPAPEREPPTAGEMMEEILEGRRDSPPPAAAVTRPPVRAATANQTQFFPGSSALELPPSPEVDFFEGAPEFASLSLDYETPKEPSARAKGEQSESRSEKGGGWDPGAQMEDAPPPVIEATVVEEVEVEPALVPTQPSGLEIFAMTDPFGSAKAPPAPAPVPNAIADLPPRHDDTSVAGSLPPRRRTDDLELDIGHFFTDEND